MCICYVKILGVNFRLGVGFEYTYLTHIVYLRNPITLLLVNIYQQVLNRVVGHDNRT